MLALFLVCVDGRSFWKPDSDKGGCFSRRAPDVTDGGLRSGHQLFARVIKKESSRAGRGETPKWIKEQNGGIRRCCAWGDCSMMTK